MTPPKSAAANQKGEKSNMRKASILADSGQGQNETQTSAPFQASESGVPVAGITLSSHLSKRESENDSKVLKKNLSLQQLPSGSKPTISRKRIQPQNKKQMNLRFPAIDHSTPQVNLTLPQTGAATMADQKKPNKSPLRTKPKKSGSMTADAFDPVASLKDRNPKLFNNYLLESKDLDNLDTFVADDSPEPRRDAINIADGLYRSDVSSEKSDNSVKIFDTGLSLNQMVRNEEKRAKKYELKKNQND